MAPAAVTPANHDDPSHRDDPSQIKHFEAEIEARAKAEIERSLKQRPAADLNMPCLPVVWLATTPRTWRSGGCPPPSALLRVRGKRLFSSRPSPT
jgi:hypothetical protein